VGSCGGTPLAFLRATEDGREVGDGHATVYHSSVAFHEEGRGVAPPGCFGASDVTATEGLGSRNSELVDGIVGVGMRSAEGREDERLEAPVGSLAERFGLLCLESVVFVEWVEGWVAYSFTGERGSDADIEGDGSHTAERGGRG
jgi:hypothetical protein